MESPTLIPNPSEQNHVTISTGATDATDSPEPSRHITNTPSLTFKGDLIILPNAQARISPTCASIADPSQHTLHLFADASFPGHDWHKGPSKPSAPAGAAVFWKPWPCTDPVDPWHSRAFQILACHNSRQAELYAVVAALETATLLAHLMPDLRRVTIFSDCQGVMNTLAAAEGSYPSALDPLVKRAFEACGSLRDKRNIRVAVCWCPGHVGIVGNEKADELSKEIRRYNFRHLVPKEQPTRVSGYEIPSKYLERARRGHWWKDEADFEWTANMPRKRFYPVAASRECDDENYDYEDYDYEADDGAYNDEDYNYDADDEFSDDEFYDDEASATLSLYSYSSATQSQTRKRERSISDPPEYPCKRQRTGRLEHGIKQSRTLEWTPTPV
ncbi:hypothetical protein CaCOL14_006619 [Colletotrichum acutatum]|uniref:RNase H type-1 domain-containing protein n=1 Tax=Glomerella acutata TaxID=27357 RepID=A0AAD8XLM2_GLOAC|nr:uncharacterized protein BDZ83DRAFT_748046 [Colletotrichum acutatum]KAK1729646.1 hypothetical protein BDZ83DRAFT_748046 [Colletotrichum acutatum]